MPANQAGGRIMSIKSHVPAELMRTGRFEVEHLRKLERGISELSERTCLIYDRSSPTIADVMRVARKWVTQHHIRILFLDYIQRIRPSRTGRNANKAEKVGEVAQGLKEIARELRIPVVALAQVGRQAAGRQPRMDDLSDSGEIEKEADVVITLDRPHEYDESQPECLANLSIEKNRHGPTWTIKAAWLPETMRFEDYEESDYA
jgi:replicative DNA helicase